jgi:hypothetical protein
MISLKRAKRVRMHLMDEPGRELPSIEGLLLSRRNREYVIAKPVLHMAVGANPAVPESGMLVIPRERVAFYEVIRS